MSVATPVASPVSPRTAPAPAQARRGRPGRGAVTPGRFYLGLAVVCVAAGALSILFASTPSYDPWSWSLWGREIVHGHLTITTTGTSWKPLPMVLTIPFALLGSAGPDLWLIVARAGALAAVAMTFRIAYRLTRQAAASFAADGGPGTRASWATLRAPALLAGLIAAVSLTFAGADGYISSNALGYSEGLTAALLLVAIERHLDGRPRQTFAIGFLIALDRPEVWLFWVPYGLWLCRCDPPMRATVLIAFVAQPVVWFVPVYLGSGHFGSSVTRAQHPRANSHAFASIPFVAELRDGAWPTMLLRIKGAATLLVVAVGAIGVRTVRRGGRAAPATPKARALTATALIGLGGAAWLVLIAVMTQLGFSGNDRYLVLGTALIDICGAVGFAWLALELGRAAVTRWRRRPATGTARRRTAVTGAAIATAAFLLVPNWVGGSLVSLPRLDGAMLYQAHLRQGLDRVIARYGGAGRVLACGTVMTEGFQVPMVAYALNVATPRVLGPPPAGTAPGGAPNLILQTRDTRSSALLPIVHAWPRVHYTYQGASGPFRLFTHCGPTSS